MQIRKARIREGGRRGFMLYAILFDGQSEWDFPMLVGLICIATFYIILIKRSVSVKDSHKQLLLFFFGLIALYITLGSPLAMISHLSFSTHMIQMSILYFIIPPILILGIPLEFFQKKGKNSQFQIGPTISLFTFAFLFFMYHLPVILNVLSQNSIYHNGYLLLLFLLSFSMWWPIAGPSFQSSMYNNNRRKQRFAHLSGLVIMPACLLFIVNALFGGMDNPFIGHAAADLCIPSHINTIDLLPPIFNSKLDQLFAGIVMLGLHKLGIFMTLHIGKTVEY